MSDADMMALILIISMSSGCVVIAISFGFASIRDVLREIRDRLPEKPR